MHTYFVNQGKTPGGREAPQLDLQDQEIKSTWAIPAWNTKICMYHSKTSFAGKRERRLPSFSFSFLDLKNTDERVYSLYIIQSPRKEPLYETQSKIPRFSNEKKQAYAYS